MALSSYSQVPGAFLHCHDAACPMAATCLRQQAFRLVPQPGGHVYDYISTLNPTIAADKPCTYYLPDTPVRAARGFKRAHCAVPHDKYLLLQLLLGKYMGKTSFYQFRNGRRLIMPEMQEKILAALRECGAPEPVEFDAYEDTLDWRNGYL